MSVAIVVTLCIAMAALTFFAAAWIWRHPPRWLRRPPEPREEPTKFLAMDELPEAEERTTYLRYEHCFAAAAPEPTEFIPTASLPFMQRPAPEPEPEPEPWISEELETAETVAAPAPAPPVDLGPLLDEASEAFELAEAERRSETDLHRLAVGAEASWIRALERLAEAATADNLAPLEQELESPEESRRIAAALTLLEHGDPATAERLVEQLESGDPEQSAWLRLVFERWSGPAATNLKIERARAQEVPWLQLIEDALLDPGEELLDELFASADDERRWTALRLAILHESPERYAEFAERELLATNLDRRIAAVEFGVFQRQTTAWLLCRQLASASSHARALELLACFGSALEQDLVIARAQRSSATAEDLWRVCLSGRLEAATLAAERVRETPDDAWAEAGLRHVIGRSSDDASSADLLAHWDDIRETLAPGERYLFGYFFSADTCRTAFLDPDPRHREAIARELLFRTAGACRLPTTGSSAALIERARQIAALELDFTAKFIG